MTDAIDFLEQLGRNAQLRHAPAVELERMLATSGIAPQLRSALLADDPPRLRELLGAQPTLCCLIVKPEPTKPDEDEEEDEEDEEAVR